MEEVDAPRPKASMVAMSMDDETRPQKAFARLVSIWCVYGCIRIQNATSIYSVKSPLYRALGQTFAAFG